jgi:hypothetical protein
LDTSRTDFVPGTGAEAICATTMPHGFTWSSIGTRTAASTVRKTIASPSAPDGV